MFGGNKSEVSVEITRPANATAYIANDVVSGTTTATIPSTFAISTTAKLQQRGLGLGGYIVGARLKTDQESNTARFRVHLWNANTPTLPADNAAFNRLYADNAKCIGSFSLAAMTSPASVAGASDSAIEDFTLRIPFVGAADDPNIYATLETLDGFTPTSGQKFTLTLLAELDP